jgi:hypothetical protein
MVTRRAKAKVRYRPPKISSMAMESQVERYSPILREFGAVQISEALKNPPGFGFSAEAISSSWRLELLREYQLLRAVSTGRPTSS